MNLDKSSWPRVKFGDVVRLNTDRCADPVAAGIERYVGLEHIEPGDLRIRRWGLVEEGTTFTNLFGSGQVLFGKRRAYQRKVAVADFEGICSGDIYVFEPKNDRLMPELLPFLCQTEAFYEHAVGTSAGSLSPRTNWKQLASFEFTLPSLEEQQKLTSLLKSLNKARRTIDDGRETAEKLWVPVTRSLMGVVESDEESSIIRGERSFTSAGWPLIRVDDICTTKRQGVQVGPFGGSVSTRHFAPVGTPVLKINNISEQGSLDLTDLVFLDRSHAKLLSGRYSVEKDDVITAAQATIGRTAIVSDEVSGAIISQHLIRIALDPNRCLSEWLHACFYTPLVLRQLHSVVQGGTRAGLNTNDVRNLIVPLPPLAVQEAFCSRLGSIRKAPAEMQARLEQAKVMHDHFLRGWSGA